MRLFVATALAFAIVAGPAQASFRDSCAARGSNRTGGWSPNSAIARRLFSWISSSRSSRPNTRNAPDKPVFSPPPASRSIAYAS